MSDDYHDEQSVSCSCSFCGKNQDEVSKLVAGPNVYICDECFLTGTAAEVTPIREVDARVIGNGARGPMTEKLQSAYFDVVAGKNPDYIQHLTYIN